jgi:ADP-ribose pyrophosphatase YjhB (NUDIX family)
MFKEISGKIWRRTPRLVRLKIIRFSQSKFTASAAAVITDESGRLLLLDHVLRPGLSWGLPGGFLEAGEQPEDAIRRELREETGLRLENVRLLRTRVISRHIEFLFRAEAEGPAEAKSGEIREAGWFAPGRLPEKMSEAQKSLIEKVLREEI